ncbi:MAG: BlaI/MecI/CopY family transcriptional regulator [Bacteroidota bacterium]|nr:BlaI/MecI/CopY family transcriptional regulator [Bacteroidota bacterium]
METLTTREEEIMQILWTLKKAFVKEIIAEIQGEKPPYNTVSSVVRILKKKGFVGYNQFGNTYQYYPKISKSKYKKFTFGEMMKDYFDNSYKKVVSFMVENDELNTDEISELENIIKEGKKKSDK